MNVINQDVILALVTAGHFDDVSPIQILDWHIDKMTEKCINTYASEISRLAVRYQPSKGESTRAKEKIFLIKDPTKAPMYELLKNKGWYENEVAIYAEILPQMYTIIENEYFTPQRYYSNNQMSLVLEDLSLIGFKCADRVEKLDLEHCIYSLKCLAKFHALSVKLEKTRGLPELVKRNLLFQTNNEEMLRNVITQQIPTFINFIPQHLREQYPNMINQFENLSFETLIAINNSSSRTDIFGVLNHGDFNINNILFKYDSLGMIKDIRLIDFQLSHWNSPANDLLTFIITSMKFEVYQKYFPLLLSFYLDTVNKILRQLGYPTYNMQSLLDDMDSLYPYALYLLSCVVPLIAFDPNDPIDIKNMIKGEKMDLSLGKGTFKQKGYQENSMKWFEHFAQKGTIRIDEEK